MPPYRSSRPSDRRRHLRPVTPSPPRSTRRRPRPAVEPAGVELHEAPALPAKPQQFPQPPSKSLAENATWRSHDPDQLRPDRLDLDGKAAPQTVASFIFLSQKGSRRRALPPTHDLGALRPPVRRPDGQRQWRSRVRLRHRERAYGRRLPQWHRRHGAHVRPNSNGSQFFIVYDDTTLPTDGGGYSIFGKVVEGLDIVDAVAQQGVDGGAGDGAPKQAISILSVDVAQKT